MKSNIKWKKLWHICFTKSCYSLIPCGLCGYVGSIKTLALPIFMFTVLQQSNSKKKNIEADLKHPHLVLADDLWIVCPWRMNLIIEECLFVHLYPFYCFSGKIHINVNNIFNSLSGSRKGNSKVPVGVIVFIYVFAPNPHHYRGFC